MIVAELFKWNGEIVRQEIKREWIDDIVAAVVGQYFFASNKDHFSIRGFDYKHINVYEVKDEKHRIRKQKKVQGEDLFSANGLQERKT